MSTLSDNKKKDYVRFLRMIADEIEANKDFAQTISERLSSTNIVKQKVVINLNPFKVYSEKGEVGLFNSLNQLDLEHLKQVIGEHRLDPSQLSRKWRNKERLIKFIVERIASRSQHGDVFMKDV